MFPNTRHTLQRPAGGKRGRVEVEYEHEGTANRAVEAAAGW